MKRFIEKWLVELFVAAVVAAVGFIVTTQVVNAEQTTRINNLESSIEQLRTENNAAHKQILDVLLRK
jgi:cell division protein FtsL